MKRDPGAFAADSVMSLSKQPGVKDLPVEARRWFAKAIQAEQNQSDQDVIDDLLQRAIDAC